MTSTANSFDPSPRSLLGELRPYGPLVLAAVLFVLVYGVELSGFGLSIDEEVATFVAYDGQTWVLQGRWGMGLLTILLPNLEAIPLLSTVLFGAGLVFATWRATRDFSLSLGRAYLFAAVHVGFPVWLHIAQFNTLAGGFGFGIAAAALGAGAAARGGRRPAIAAVFLIAFAIAVYQTLAIYTLLYLVLSLSATTASATTNPTTRAAALRWAKGLALWVAGLVAYWIIQRLWLAITGTQMTYVDGYVHLSQLRSDPVGSLHAILDFLKALLLGGHPIYLGWGVAILGLTWLGLAPVALLTRLDGRRRLLTQWLKTLALSAFGIALVAVPVVISVASLPIRAYVAWPLLAAWLASRVASDAGTVRRPWAVFLAVAYFSIVAISIGSSMFYADEVVHASDSALAQRLIPAMQLARGEPAAPDTPYTVAGTYEFPMQGQVQRAELFGTSFFEKDGGNVYRVHFFMQLLGLNGFTPVPLANKPELIPDVQAMPNWPAAGSVKMVQGVVVIKLGTPTAQQLPTP
jgi:Glucosyl transferase GtrII